VKYVHILNVCEILGFLDAKYEDYLIKYSRATSRVSWLSGEKKTMFRGPLGNILLYSAAVKATSNFFFLKVGWV
jgi:hypothetical protein